MDESIEASNLSATPLNSQQVRLNKINEIKKHFIGEIKQTELMSKRLSKHIASFDLFDKSSVVLSAKSSSLSIASYVTVIGTTVRASLSLTFSLSKVLVKKLLKTTRNKKKSIIKLLC